MAKWKEKKMLFRVAVTTGSSAFWRSGVKAVISGEVVCWFLFFIEASSSLEIILNQDNRIQISPAFEKLDTYIKK